MTSLMHFMSLISIWYVLLVLSATLLPQFFARHVTHPYNSYCIMYISVQPDFRKLTVQAVPETKTIVYNNILKLTVSE